MFRHVFNPAEKFDLISNPTLLDFLLELCFILLVPLGCLSSNKEFHVAVLNYN